MTRPPQKRLLALDGGGLMGLISLGILQQMEDQLRAAHGGQDTFRLRDYFDYIAGTSTGAIIAAGLMMGRSVKEIRDIYINDGPAMFAPISWPRRVWSLLSHKYPRGPIADALKREFTDLSVLELQAQGFLPKAKHLMMVMHNADTDSCWPISTNPDAKYNNLTHDDCNLKLKLWQLVRASTAAPSFFPLEEVHLGKRVFKFQDGGLTAHNNPALKLFQMATNPRYRLRRAPGSDEFGWETGEDKLLLVSVGTGKMMDPRRGLRLRGMALPTLARYAPKALMRGIAIENDVACRVVGRCVHGGQIDREVGNLVDLVPGNRAFTYARYDVDLSDEGLRSLCVDPRGQRLDMDNANAIEVFDEIGRKAITDTSRFVQGFAGLLS